MNLVTTGSTEARVTESAGPWGSGAIFCLRDPLIHPQLDETQNTLLHYQPLASKRSLFRLYKVYVQLEMLIIQRLWLSIWMVLLNIYSYNIFNWVKSKITALLYLQKPFTATFIKNFIISENQEIFLINKFQQL